MTPTAGGPSRIRLIVNGKRGEAGGLRAGVETLRNRGEDVDVRLTWEPGQAEFFAREAADSEYDTVVAAGGDGTIHEVVNGLMAAGVEAEQLPTLGVLPLGTANDFATSCGMQFELPRALQRMPETAAMPIDLVRANDRFFVNLATGGFGSRVTHETPEELKKLLGGAAYLLTGLSRFSGIRPVQARLTGPEFDWSGEVLVLAVGNGRQAGGGHLLCPDALVDDGLLDVGVLPRPEEGQWRDVLSRLVSDHRNAVSSAMITARQPWLELEAEDDMYLNLDGEPVQASRFRFAVVPGAIRCHLPADAAVLGASG